MPKLHNRHHNTAPRGAVYIGRGTPWGNPYSTQPDTPPEYRVNTRDEAVDKFEQNVLPYIDHNAIEFLRGKDLICSCAPARCHGDSLLRKANYVTRGRYKVINEDCRTAIPRLGFGYDFIFADPPFNIGHPYKGFEDSKPWTEFAEFTMEWVAECWGHCNGVMCLHGPDRVAELYIMAALAMGFSERRIAWVNWHYRFGVCQTSNWIDARCHCLIFAKDPNNYTWNPEAVMVESDRVAYGDKRVTAEKGGRRLPGTVWGVPSDGPYWGRVTGSSGERRPEHPNQLPELYLARLIKAYTNPGDNCLDPFAGSGTTATVATALGRNCVTMDVSPENAAGALERIRRGPVREL